MSDPFLDGIEAAEGLMDLFCQVSELSSVLQKALIEAKKTIRIWHGEDGWELYDRCSPEMKTINAAIAQAMVIRKKL